MALYERLKSIFLKIKSRLTSSVALIIVCVLCVASLLYNYWSREDSVKPAQIAGAVIIPFQEGLNSIGSFLFRSEEDRISLAEARDRIDTLEKQNAGLKREISDLNELRLENERLRRLLDMKNRLSDYEMTEASVIGNDGVNMFVRFTLNKGTMDGIQVNMNVINEMGLVGIITAVGPNYSVCTAIIEDGTNVSAMTKNEHLNLIVSGDLSTKGLSEMRFANALSSIDFSKDSTLVTSFISDRYLPGLLIGYTESVTPNEDGLTQNGLVRTAVDFTNLHEVLIIKTLREDYNAGENGGNTP
ncbi:MAG: rod shape-determining protein MreC [Lachnospiraceae bacterium]|nr:rod shape-determining protein MreC [Lachnospiraceae bacterium]